MYRNDPKIITAKFNSVCSETGKTITKGEQCVYYPLSKKVYCLNSKQAENFKNWDFDINLGFNY